MATINPLDLVFQPDGREPLELVFGDQSAAAVPEYEISGGGQISGLRRASAAMAYDFNVSRPALALRSSRYQEARPIAQVRRSAWQDAHRAALVIRSGSEPGQPLSTVQRSVWQQADQLSRAVRSVDEQGQPLAAGARGRFQQAIELSGATRSAFQTGVRISVSMRGRFEEVIRLWPVLRSGFELGVHRILAAHDDMQPGVLTLVVHRQRFQQGRYPPPGASRRPVVRPTPDWCYVPTDPIELVFRPDNRAPLELLFECERHGGGQEPEQPGAPLYILPARYYMSVHSLTAHLLPGLTSFAINDVQISADVGSYGWTFSARVRPEMIEALSPSTGVPASIRITFDGLQWVCLVDRLQSEERFGQRALRIGGRSVTALLAAPYARETARYNSADRNAQQLAGDALEYTGVDLDWGIEDWYVPAGAWSHIGTPLAAVQAIAEAAGGYLQSHRTQAKLLVRHPYPDLPGGVPGLPWYWNDLAVAADVELAPDALMVTSIERRDGPDINGVYVSGVNMGVNALYKLTGTAGDKLASPVTDPLIVASEVARMRGRSIVGAGGPKQIVTLELPILTGGANPGVLEVGQLVQINYSTPMRGRVRSVSSRMAFGQAPRQTVSIEHHLETA